MTEKPKKRTMFELAHAARKGDIPPEDLPNAARLLYKDTTLKDDDLAAYSTSQGTFPPPKQLLQTHRRAVVK